MGTLRKAQRKVNRVKTSSPLLDGKVWGAALLVAGTAIGAGMLALPVVTAGGGTMSTLLIYFLSWLIAITSGLLFVELSLAGKEKSHLVSMGRLFFGPIGSLAAWLLYLFLFYPLTVAYLAAGGAIFQRICPFASSSWISFVLFAGMACFIVAKGTRWVDGVNRWLIGGLIITYLAFLFLALSKSVFPVFQEGNPKLAIGALPVIFTSFSYQGSVPTLVHYLKRDQRKIRVSLLIGTLMPLIVYVLWDLLIKTVIPLEGANGLLKAKEVGKTAIDSLTVFLPHSSIGLIGTAFAFFALTTSCLGVTLGLKDFLADSLSSLKQEKRRELLALFLTFVPSVFVAILYPSIFLQALKMAGGIGCACLLVLLPTLMVWVKRYKRKERGGYEVKGGKVLLLFLIGVVLFELFVENILH